ncbi:recombinase family protein [Bacillus cereus]|uniref:recombinase family protein n=1 Tax=Bacillus cereus TaxID=1396 RepID=UPI0018F617F2|nr:recombinase family protein [Bacillus cereus]MBJ8054888.1 recombinase family protein [Bacillus cereus]
MNYAYFRVATLQQDYTFQKQEILTYCKTNNIELLEECIFEEKQSGKNMEREQFQILMRQLQSGDTLIVYNLDRLGRNLSDMIRTHEKLIKNDIGVIAIHDNIDTRKKDDMTTKVMVTILSLFADIERNYILDRTQAGRTKYVANGGKLGRTPKINKSKTDLILELLNQGKTKQEIADFLNVDRTTIYRTLKRNGY